jgi:peptidoglycan hydrolase-like protein with peptidoglycan-binding domain
MRLAALLFASSALAGALLVGGCSDGGMFGRSSTATPSPAAQRQAATAPQQQASADTREAQQQLKSLGLYDGAVDGVWGPETQAAVERYQRERGLAASGRIDAATRTSLAETTAGRAGATTRGTGSPQKQVSLNNETDVRTVQNRLRQLNYYQGEANGTWNSETQVAMENFQRARGLPVGQLNQATLNAMGLEVAGSNRAAGGMAERSTSPGAQGGGIVDRRSAAGSSGTVPQDTREYTGRQQTGTAPREADIAPSAGPGAGARAAVSPRSLSAPQIRAVQQKLADEGHYRAGIDGVWGPQSNRALVAFQTQNQLRADGRIDPPTASALGIRLPQLSRAGSSGMPGSGPQSGSPQQ